MKNYMSIFVVIMAVLLVGFTFSNEDTDVRGNGVVIKTTRSVEPFTEIAVDGVFNIYLKQGNYEVVEVEMDENLQDYVMIEVVNGRLKIKTRSGIDINKMTKNNIFVTLKNVHKIEVNAVGKIMCEETLKLDKLSLVFNGVGKTHLKLECNQFNATVSSVGQLILEGKSIGANMRNSGVGSLNAYDFHVDYLSLQNSGIGSVEVCANKEIDIISSGIGSVRYKGTAEVKRISSSGLGSVKREK